MVKNVLLVTIDSWRADYFDPADEYSPELSSLADAGTTFPNAFATGTGTGPSFPGILTGTMPLSYGGLGPLTTDRPRLSENLSAGRLRTGGFQTNPFLSARFNYDAGFDKFEDYQNTLMGVASRLFPRGIESDGSKLAVLQDRLNLAEFLKKTYQYVWGKPRPYVSAEVIVDDALSWLETTETPFFCWTHFMDVHHPCYPPEPYRAEFGVADVSHMAVSEWYSQFSQSPEELSSEQVETMTRLYRAAIEYIDDQVGRLVDHLRTTDRFEDTLMLVTSDHGELFGEHGQYGKPDVMYDELLRVPLISVNGPDHLAVAREELRSLLDLPPLIHDALGVPQADAYEGQIPGRSPPRDYVMAEMEVEGDAIVGARSRDWLYEGDEIQGEHRISDLRGGSRSQVNSSEDLPAPAVSLQRAVLDRLETLDVDTHRLEAEVDGEMRDRLEDLGYL